MSACRIILALFLSIAAVHGDTTTTATSTTIEIPGIHMPPGMTTLPNVAASIISANPTATTFSIACIQGDQCGLWPKEMHVVGPSTYRIDMEDPNKDTYATGHVECQIARSAVCTESFSGYQEPNDVHVTTHSPQVIGTYGLLVTAGVDKLGGVEAKPTNNGSVALASPTTMHFPAYTGSSNANAVVAGGLLSLAAGVFGGLLL